MANFLENVFANCKRPASAWCCAKSAAKLRQRLGQGIARPGRASPEPIFGEAGVQPGDRCALLGAEFDPLDGDRPGADGGRRRSSSRCTRGKRRRNWRHDAGLRPAASCFVSDAALGEAVAAVWPEAPPRVPFDEVLAKSPRGRAFWPRRIRGRTEDLVTIIYTSGTSGEPKGVCLNVAQSGSHAGLHDCSAWIS